MKVRKPSSFASWGSACDRVIADHATHRFLPSSSSRPDGIDSGRRSGRPSPTAATFPGKKGSEGAGRGLASCWQGAVPRGCHLLWIRLARPPTSAPSSGRTTGQGLFGRLADHAAKWGSIGKTSPGASVDRSGCSKSGSARRKVPSKVRRLGIPSVPF